MLLKCYTVLLNKINAIKIILIQFLWSELFESITVNGKVYTFGAEEGQFTDSSISSPHWYTNSAFKMGTIDLVSGENTITMKPMTSANLNLDFIDLLTDAVTKAI